MGLIQRLNDTDPSKFYWGNQQPGTENLNNVNPRNIPFGNDRPDGGSSKQPYIVSKPVDNNLNPSFYNDFILRGGALAPLSAAEDVARLTKYFTDTQNPNGLLFIAKQNILSKSGTKTEASTGIGYGLGLINEGIYTPASTLGQALVGFTGTHLNKQGIDPTGKIFGLGINTYQEAIFKNQLDKKESEYSSASNNRLVRLTTSIIEKTSSQLKNQPLYKLNTSKGDVLISYNGGADSIVGFGKTNIKFATDNTGETPLKSLNNLSTSNLFSSIKFSTWDLKQLTDSGINENFITEPDFREKLTEKNLGSTKTYLTSTPGYNTKQNNIEEKFGLNNPGSPLRDRSNYKSGSLTPGQSFSTPLDSINAYPIYKSESSKSETFGNRAKEKGLLDIIPFSIAILNNDDQNVRGSGTTFSFKKFMHFRAFIDSFSDSYDANWKSIDYMGRAEKLYKYSGFDRKISMGFTVAAQSKDEINVMYDKLNFLASSLAPEYIDSLTSGYMAGNIAYITLGDYIVDQPGIITSLTFDVPEESPWEIENDQLEAQSTIRRLPHMIKVTGFNFTPIHKFRPSKQNWKNDFDGAGNGIPVSTLLRKPGDQKYIDTQFKFDPMNFPKLYTSDPAAQTIEQQYSEEFLPSPLGAKTGPKPTLINIIYP